MCCVGSGVMVWVSIRRGRGDFIDGSLAVYMHRDTVVTTLSFCSLEQQSHFKFQRHYTWVASQMPISGKRFLLHHSMLKTDKE